MRKEGDSGKKQKVVFMGTPWIATMALKGLIDRNYDVAAVITQPDKLINKKGSPIFSPVKVLALQKGIKILQPLKIGEAKDELEKINADMFVTCAYGQFIPDSILNLPKLGCFNVHASVLPALRGGAPIHWAIISGFDETGITIMKTVKKMDAGDIYAIYKIAIDKEDTTTTLTKKLGDLAYKSVVEQIPKIFNNEIKPVKQLDRLVSYAYNITKEQEKLNFDLPSFYVHNWIRALSEIPGAFGIYQNKRIKFFKSDLTGIKSVHEPGTISNLTPEGIFVSTKDFEILIREIQIEGKNRILYSNYHNGNRLFKVGMRFN